MDEDDSTLSDKTIQKILSGDQISYDDLSAVEKKYFQRAVASGELSKLIEPWDPWWLKPSARTISLSQQGTQLVQPLVKQETVVSTQDDMENDQSHDIPPGPETPLPPVSKLSSTEPSPLLAVHLVDIIYSYCFTLRLYNGDWQSDALGSAMVILSISSVMGQSGQPETVLEAVSHCLEQTCSPAFSDMGGLQFGFGLLDDVISLLYLGGSAIICLLCDLQRLIQAAEKELKLEKPRNSKRVEIRSKLKLAERKTFYMMCWVHEQPGEAWSSLAAIVRAEKVSAMDCGGNISGTSKIEDKATMDRLGKGSSLSVEKPEDVLISPNGAFSAGFHAIGVNVYCFAIWFAKPSQGDNRTLVWMANRDQPVNGRFSKLSMLKNGNLILTDAGQSIVWATNTVSSSTVQLQLHDNGNLVLQTSGSGSGSGSEETVILWQSFDSPTDTLLPNQALTRYTKLISSRTQTNHSSGFYKLFFDDDNVLRLVFNGPETSSIYWPDPWILSNVAGRSRYNDTRIAVFDSRGHFRSSDRVEFWAADYGAGPHRRLTLDFDGNLRLYSLEEASGTWTVSWQAMLKPCRIHGGCGPNSLCSYDPGSGRKCNCLPIFKMKNHTDWSYGCEPEFNLSCNKTQATFLQLSSADFYGYNIHILRNYTLESCKKKCLESCDCKGFQYKFNKTYGVHNCYPKRVFRNGHRAPSYVGALFVKVPKAFVSPQNQPIREQKLDCSDQANNKQLDRVYKKKTESWSLKFLLCFVCAFGGVEIICIGFVWCFLSRSHQASSSAVMKGYYHQVAATGFRKFTYTELKKATRGFNEEIGRGGSSIVYKGILSDNRMAAIKRLNEANGGEAEFLAELDIIGRLNHKNLIEMWGYCVEGKHRLLVYEYMEHGSLAENLHSNTLNWEKRFEIAVGTAKGLAYLHEECLEWILHCDVKPQNILLDSNYMPKVADFGLSKLLNRGSGKNSSFSKVRGTRGYMAPEWIFNLPVTSKVDVYSYGIVILEMITKASQEIDVHIDDSEGMMERRLISWVREKMQRTTGQQTSWMEEIIDPNVHGKYDMPRMELLVRVALLCVEENQDARPTMSNVVQILTASWE
ncbi:hypothetical protein F0562_007795 [Nyssa sinensis]|uniref:non-specific serine/threonine protein kinase n=1 Tax=Nyssa sinensis TaxID=561372 RepID=A0A5J5A4T4_9ASTE|nr:hypothetical protein F0562_007795 [Nyssa sinensis]